MYIFEALQLKSGCRNLHKDGKHILGLVKQDIKGLVRAALSSGVSAACLPLFNMKV
jgi:hypothetical protein